MIDVCVMTVGSAHFLLSEAHVVCPDVDLPHSALIYQSCGQIVTMIAAQHIRGISLSQQLCSSPLSLRMWLHQRHIKDRLAACAS